MSDGARYFASILIGAGSAMMLNPFFDTPMRVIVAIGVTMFVHGIVFLINEVMD